METADGVPGGSPANGGVVSGEPRLGYGRDHGRVSGLLQKGLWDKGERGRLAITTVRASSGIKSVSKMSGLAAA